MSNSLGVSHKEVTKNKTQANVKGQPAKTQPSPKSGSFELMTPSGLAGSGLSGINRASNKSSEKAVGSGNGASNQSSKSGLGGGNASMPTKNSGSKNFGE